MGHFIIKHLERQAKKTSGTICCGGIITTLALDCGVDVSDFIEDMGEKSLTLEVLKQVKFMNVDRFHQGYFLQKAGDHFPIPDPTNTYVSGWHYKINWRMNEEVHRQIVANRPPQLPWLPPRFIPHMPYEMPHPEQPEPVPPQLEGPHPNPDEAGPSNRRRRRRRQPNREEDDVSINQRIDRLDESINHNFAQLNSRLDQNFAHINSRMDGFENMMTSMYDRLNTWNPYPPPPPED